MIPGVKGTQRPDGPQGREGPELEVVPMANGSLLPSDPSY